MASGFKMSPPLRPSALNSPYRGSVPYTGAWPYVVFGSSDDCGSNGSILVAVFPRVVAIEPPNDESVVFVIVCWMAIMLCAVMLFAKMCESNAFAAESPENNMTVVIKLMFFILYSLFL